MLIHDRFDAYIGWEQFERNQRQLAENSALGKLLSAPRHGPSVLAGLVVCGRCGHRMMVGYDQAGSKKRLGYRCLRGAIDYGEVKCQCLSGEALEALVVDRLLQAVSPASLELSLAAAEDVQHPRRQLDDHWRQRLTRSRYEVEQARRQYAAVDPEHRLVARELERRWNESLSADQRLQADYARFQQDSPAQLSADERELICSLAHDLPALWRAETTTPEDRQTIARLLPEQVTVAVEGDSEVVDVELRWAGGFVSRHALTRPVQTYQQLSNYQALATRVEQLREQRATLADIAATLNAEGFRPPKRTSRFTKGMVSQFLRESRARLGIHTRSECNERHLRPDEWWLADLASELSTPIATLHRWRKVGWINSPKVAEAQGRWAVHADAEELKRMRQLRDQPRGWPQPYPTELTTPKAQKHEPKADGHQQRWLVKSVCLEGIMIGTLKSHSTTASSTWVSKSRKAGVARRSNVLGIPPRPNPPSPTCSPRSGG